MKKNQSRLLCLPPRDQPLSKIVQAHLGNGMQKEERKKLILLINIAVKFKNDFDQFQKEESLKENIQHFQSIDIADGWSRLASKVPGLTNLDI